MTSSLTSTERDAVATLCLLAAFADGRKDDAERDRLQAIVDGLGAAFDPARMQRVLLGQATVEAEASRLKTPASRMLAYEMAVAVCDADGVADDAEQAFLAHLRHALGLDASAASRVEADGAALASLPPDAPALDAFGVAAPVEAVPSVAAPSVAAAPDGNEAVDGMILRYAMLNGALELLPQTMAGLAIVPIQTKMVYRVGLHYGHRLDAGHVRELSAAVGLGVASQVVESYARTLFGGLAGTALQGVLGKKKGKKAGKRAKTAVATTTGAVISFASTYALGRVAKAHYSSGRRLTPTAMRNLFEREAEQARELYATHRPAIEAQARSTDLPALLSQIRAPLDAPTLDAAPAA